MCMCRFKWDVDAHYESIALDCIVQYCIVLYCVVEEKTEKYQITFLFRKHCKQIPIMQQRPRKSKTRKKLRPTTEEIAHWIKIMNKIDIFLLFFFFQSRNKTIKLFKNKNKKNSISHEPHLFWEFLSEFCENFRPGLFSRILS